MIRYEYVSVYIETFGGAKCTQHNDIIDKYAQKGYRYIGFIPTKISDFGKFQKIDLIFEIQE